MTHPHSRLRHTLLDLVATGQVEQHPRPLRRPRHHTPRGPLTADREHALRSLLRERLAHTPRPGPRWPHPRPVLPTPAGTALLAAWDQAHGPHGPHPSREPAGTVRLMPDGTVLVRADHPRDGRHWLVVHTGWAMPTDRVNDHVAAAGHPTGAVPGTLAELADTLD